MGHAATSAHPQATSRNAIADKFSKALSGAQRVKPASDLSAFLRNSAPVDNLITHHHGFITKNDDGSDSEEKRVKKLQRRCRDVFHRLERNKSCEGCICKDRHRHRHRSAIPQRKRADITNSATRNANPNLDPQLMLFTSTTY
ncbi:hypothetical protein FEM48_Zijuj05G0085200 [Ziziphus jujuba var. spinosa]|uniref:Uncharacterized protein n=1 Tax=Ziziphus jujuba var. spinosa TaxID=714518 RepID=A0A978VDX3_ZIZJJ|nr:hypothetical protein FEM48_Zijuj05G0085200 [Ziziphus jujuba var. spinosa]